MATLIVHDQTPTGLPVRELRLPGLPSSITVRELVRLRVREEVARHNAAPAPVFNGLVRPIDAEVAANGYRLRSHQWIDWAKQADAAVDAFARNGYFILVGNRQVEDLDEVIDLDDDPYVAFVKLTPLVGG